MQLNIDFTGKKENKITISVSDELKIALEKLSKVFDDKEIAKICGEYVAECAGRDIGKFIILQAKGKVPLDMAKL